MTAGRETPDHEFVGRPTYPCMRRGCGLPKDMHPVGRETTPTAASVAPAIDADHLARQREWSARTFGPGLRTKGVLDHIRKELREIEEDPHDVTEWIDVVILALDGAWRHGAEPQQIIDTIRAKQARNEARTWPDWRSMGEDQAIEHDRSSEDRPNANGDGAAPGGAS